MKNISKSEKEAEKIRERRKAVKNDIYYNEFFKKLAYGITRLKEESGYDWETYVHSIMEQTHQLCFFYCYLVNKTDKNEAMLAHKDVYRLFL